MPIKKMEERLHEIDWSLVRTADDEQIVHWKLLHEVMEEIIAKVNELEKAGEREK